MFNSLKYAKFLETKGIPRKQAEAHVQMVGEIMENHFATSQDLQNLEHSLQKEFIDFKNKMGTEFTEFKNDMGAQFTEFKSDMSTQFTEFKSDIKSDFAFFRQEIDHRFVQFEQKMILKLGTLVSVAIGVAVALTKLIG